MSDYYNNILYNRKYFIIVYFISLLLLQYFDCKIQYYTILYTNFHRELPKYRTILY